MSYAVQLLEEIKRVVNDLEREIDIYDFLKYVVSVATKSS